MMTTKPNLLALQPDGFTWAEIFCCLNTLMVVGFSVGYRLLNVQARYGRFTSAQSTKEGGFRFHPNQPVPAKLAWLLMETPNLVLGGLIVHRASQTNSGSDLGWLVVTLFMTHYFIRTIIYSYLMKGGKPMPLDTFLTAVLFTTVNGAVQSYHHLFEAEYSHGENSLSHPRVQLGITMFVLGFMANQWADDTLRRLRKDDNDTNYYLPKGFLFNYLSAPNLVGEIMEWIGYAVLANTWVAIGFAVSTSFIVGNRAIGHHEWYVKTFKDYPKERKALIPFVY